MQNPAHICIFHKTTLLFVLAIFILHSSGYAQYPAIRFEHYAVRQGLSQGSGYAITQDKDGFIWMGTQNGLNRFDGYQVQIFYHGTNGYTGSNHITSLLTDSAGNTWIGSTAGISILDFTSRKFIAASRFLNKPSVLDSTAITRIWQDKAGNVWILSFSKGVFMVSYPKKEITQYFSNEDLSNNLVDIVQDKKGTIWLATQQKIFHFDASQKEFIQTPVAAIHEKTTIRAILTDKDNRLWIGSFDDGVYIVSLPVNNGSPVKRLRKNQGKEQGLSSNDVTCLLEDRDHNIWIGTRTTGLNKYVYENGNIIPAPHKNDIPEGLSRNFVLSLFEDRQGNIWTGLSGGGFDKHDPLKYQFDLYRRTDDAGSLGDNMVFAIRKILPGYLHFGTQSSGLAELNEKTGEFINYKKDPSNPNSIIHNTVYDMTSDDSGIVWIATWGGLCSYNKRQPAAKAFQTYNNYSAVVTNLYSLLKLKNKKILMVSGLNGVFRFDLEKKQWLDWNGNEKTQTAKLIVRVFHEDERGVIWMGTEGNGLARYQNGTRSTVSFPITGDQANKVVRCIKQDGNDLWVGTDNGLFKLNMNDANITHYNMDNGLPDNVVYSLEKDQNNNLWIGTNKGLVVFNILKRTFRVYDETDGLQSNEFNTNSSYADPSGRLYFGGINGVNSFEPSRLKTNRFAPDVKLTAIKLFDTLYLSGLALDRVTKLELNHRKNFIAFEFAALNYSMSERSAYQYMMEGVDEGWLNSGSRRYVSYTGLKPGQYVFNVKYQNRDGFFSNKIARMTVNIHPPWWQTWWAYSLYVLVAATVVFSLYRNRINRLKQKQSEQLMTMVATQENERERLSRDLHDDVGIKLSAIKLYLSSLTQKLKQKKLDEANSLINNSEQLIDQTMTEVRKMLLNLSPQVLEEFGYAIAVEGLVNKINETKLIHFDLIMFGLKNGLPKDHELALYRITQELINNVLKHSEASNVSLQVGKRDGKIILLMEDNGKGFQLNKHRNGYGLKNLEARTQLLHGSIEIDSRPGKGTNVLIEIPYKTNDHA